MDPWNDPANIVTFASWLLALILDANEALVPLLEDESVMPDLPQAMQVDYSDAPMLDTLSLLSNTLHNFRVCVPINFLSDEVSYWVKPRSTTWFSLFLLEQYDNRRWLSMFRMTKASVFSLAELLKPHIEKKNTKYRLAIPVLIRVACTLFKLTHGANLTICSEMFAIGRSTVCKILRDVVHAINDTLKHEISWPQGERMLETQAKFANICSLPAVAGAIDGMHIAISKPAVGAADYFYFKSGGYSMNCQAVVDSDKRFLDIFVGMPGSTNDSRMLRRSSLHYLASHGQLFDPASDVDGQSAFLIGDSGYPLLPWLMVPHRGGRHLSISEVMFNRKLRKGRFVVENAFGILKQTFRELLDKSDLHITFLPDVILCCVILHNVLLRQSHEEVEDLLTLLQAETAARSQSGNADCNEEEDGRPVEGEADDAAAHDGLDVEGDATPLDGGSDDDEDSAEDLAASRRNELGVYLTTRRRVM